MVAGAAFKCPSCGAPLELLGEGFSDTIACGYCGSVLDARDPQHKVLSRYKAAVSIEPLIPLGTKGTLRGDKWQAIGFMRRKVRYGADDFGWSEYLLYNPTKGYRWLLESQGHWTLLAPLTDLPVKRGRS